VARHDVYVISPARNIEAIERFLDAYVDRTASEDRGDEELAMLALDPSGRPTSGDNSDWEPSKTLTRVIERGLQFTRSAFSVSLKSRDVSLAGAALAFDVDDQVIFGVSMDDEGRCTTEESGTSQGPAARNGPGVWSKSRIHRRRTTATFARGGTLPSQVSGVLMDCGVTSGNVQRSLPRFALPSRHHLACLLTNSPSPTNRRQRSRSYR
jgi:hypothetical protein